MKKIEFVVLADNVIGYFVYQLDDVDDLIDIFFDKFFGAGFGALIETGSAHTTLISMNIFIQGKQQTGIVFTCSEIAQGV